MVNFVSIVFMGSHKYYYQMHARGREVTREFPQDITSFLLVVISYGSACIDWKNPYSPGAPPGNTVPSCRFPPRGLGRGGSPTQAQIGNQFRSLAVTLKECKGPPIIFVGMTVGAFAFIYKQFQ